MSSIFVEDEYEVSFIFQVYSLELLIILKRPMGPWYLYSRVYMIHKRIGFSNVPYFVHE